MNQQKNKTILIVEDERPLAEAIKKKLETRGFETTTARTVSQALGYLKDLGEVDAVWLDHYLLGKESGLDFVAQCKGKGSPCKNIPIFVVSNTASGDKVQSYIRLGVEKYYAKAENRLEAIVSDIKAFLERPED